MARCTHPEITDLVKAVKDVFGVNVMSKHRYRETVDARMAVMVCCRSMFTTVDIGQAFGMNHSSVVHADRQHKYKYNLDSTKRHRSFRFYCDVFDFCKNRVNEKQWKQYVTISDVKDELKQEKQIRFALQEKAEEQQKLITKLKAEVRELKMYKVAMKQLLKERKARNEITT